MQVIENHSNINRPIHIDKLALSWMVCQTGFITLSPKADGEYHELKNKNYVFQCEYIENLDLYLIFDTKTYPSKHNNNIINRNKWIRTLHKKASELDTSRINTINQISEIEEYIIKDTQLLKNYLNTTTDKIKWYPKIIYTINLTSNDFLSLLDHNYDHLLGYKTDGWILSSLKNIGKLSSLNYKYKPHHELTIDIAYINDQWHSKENILTNVINNHDIKNNTIWRCYWNNGCWIPREQRLDKKRPNNQYIVNNLEELHKHPNPWTATQLQSIVKQYYYNKDLETDLNDDIKEYLQSQRTILSNIINDIINKYTIKNILDLGCGKGYIANILNNKQINISGIDIDPVNIFILKNKYWEHKYKWICDDLNLIDFNTTEKYDLIIMNNTLHTIINIDDFLETLNKIVHNKTILYLHFLDKTLIKDNSIGFIKQIQDDIFEFKYPWRTDVLLEKVISFTQINEAINKYWSLQYEVKYNNILNSEFDVFMACHKYLVYYRK